MAPPVPFSNSLAAAASLRLPPPPLLNPRSRPAHFRLPPFSNGVAIPCFPTPQQCPPTVLLHCSSPKRKLGLICSVGKSGREAASEGLAGDDADASRGQSTLPERFRHLTKEAPDRPVRWPWVIAMAILIYAWRTVWWELGNWKKAALAIVNFFGYIFKLLLAFVFHFIGDPLTGLIRCIEYCLYTARYIYSSMVTFAPVPELMRIVFFSSIILSIAEATVPDSMNSQQHLLSLSGIVGFAAVGGYIPEAVFWLLLSGFFCYSYFIKKRDGISAALPPVTVLAAVGEPWVRCLVIVTYMALAIYQHWKSTGLGKTEVQESNKLPVPLQLVALSVGIHVAAKWVRHRHLTWMIV